MNTGEEIICINNEWLSNNLTVGKKYIVITDLNWGSYYLSGDIGVGTYDKGRFVTVKEYRKLKLLKISQHDN